LTDVPDYMWPKDEWTALNMVFRGNADEAMQQRAIRHIVEILGRVNGSSFVRGEPDTTAFNEGRRWVARQIQNALTLPREAITIEGAENVRSGSDRESIINASAREFANRTRGNTKSARAKLNADK